MKAIRLAAAQQFERIDVPEPPAPGKDEALVSVHAIGVCGTDISGYLGKMPFIQFPRILGHELGVEVLAVGPGVQNLKPGDRCSVEPYLNCGHCHACKLGRTNCCETLGVLGVHRDGGMCERLLLPTAKLHRSEKLTLEQLASRSGISAGLLSQMERGQGNPSFNTLVQVAHALSVPVASRVRSGSPCWNSPGWPPSVSPCWN